MSSAVGRSAPAAQEISPSFTDKPVSMKYRGIYKLAKRGKGFLQYVGKCGELTAQEAVEKWIRKYRKS